MFNTILNTPLLISSTAAPVAPETLKIIVTTISHNSEEKWSSVGQEAMNLFLKSVKRCVTSLSLIGFLKTERLLIYRTIISCLRSFCSISVQRNYRKRLPTVPKTGKQEYFKFAFDLSVAFLCKGITENAFQQSQKQENKAT